MADPDKGLSREQVKQRIDRGWANVAVTATDRTVGTIVRENLLTYFNFIFVFLAVLVILVGSFRSLSFMVVVIINACIGIVQELRAKRELDKMNMLGAQKLTVIREGKPWTAQSEQLVRDDIVVFRAGSRICADAVVVTGQVQVNEALLTGETDEITKRAGDELTSGSFVVSGECRARLTRVGQDSYISQLTLKAKHMKKGEQSEMLRSINRMLVFVGIIIIPVGIGLFYQSYFINQVTIKEAVVSMVAALVGMIPEGLYFLTSIALAASTVRLSQAGVLLHDMKSIETLARVDVLCVDKTGTITENTMTVKDLVPMRGGKEKDEELELLMGDIAAAMTNDNITMEAVKARFTKKGGRTLVKAVAFSPKVKYSAAVFTDGAYVIGAPEMVLRDDLEKHRVQIESYAERGYRVLALASYNGIPDGKPLSGKAGLLGLVLLSNPVREEARETFKYFAEQGVEVKVISGDNPRTVSEAAKEAGIIGAERYVDASQLKTAADVNRALIDCNVFGRVTPEQKKMFVQVLKDQGHTVAMTGDGVNDVLALKDADCSVAMASGSDAAAQAAQVVLMNNDFSCMPSVVMEGRRVVNNIQRSASLFLVKNIFSILLSMFSMLTLIVYPLEAAQISLISTFTIGFPAFFIAMEPNKERIEGHFLPNVIKRALPAGITDAVIVGALVVFGQTFGVGEDDIATAATMLLAIVGFMILFRLSRPMTKMRFAVWLVSIALVIGCAVFIPGFFALTGMSTKCIMLFVVFAIITEPMMRYLTLLIEKIYELAGIIKRQLLHR